MVVMSIIMVIIKLTEPIRPIAVFIAIEFIIIIAIIIIATKVFVIGFEAIIIITIGIFIVSCSIIIVNSRVIVVKVGIRLNFKHFVLIIIVFIKPIKLNDSVVS
jgi:hypothetical protein